MIERVAVQHRNLGIATLVIGMTRGTLPVPCRVIPPVVARADADIGGDVLVARQAQIPLTVTREHDVTAIAFVFVFGVPVNHFAGHHQFLQLAGKSGRVQATHQ